MIPHYNIYIQSQWHTQSDTHILQHTSSGTHTHTHTGTHIYDMMIYNHDRERMAANLSSLICHTIKSI